MLDCGFNDVYCMKSSYDNNIVSNFIPVKEQQVENYYHKYIKYKNKYIKLKNQLTK
jgi:hypothetical protein